MRIRKMITVSLVASLFYLMGAGLVLGKSDLVSHSNSERSLHMELIDTSKPMERFTFQSGLQFDYPDAVRGIYVTGHSAGGERFNTLLDLVETTDLNAMVIDIKEDHGNLTFKVDEDSPFASISENYISDPEELMKTLEEKGIYPIARIVVFKDTELATSNPEYSFLEENGKVWKNNRGEAFVNPFMTEVWEYNLDIAKKAAELGFKEIQFDYVRFPEGFEHRDEDLTYSQGEYADSELNNIKRRVEAVTDFVAYSREELAYFGVDVSVDIFGYAATIPETPGIGQNFSEISENVDVISSMIYPSHWTSYFGIELPDREPYKLVTEYAKVETELLDGLDEPPVSRPWIQDFEAPWLYGGGAVQPYGKKEVEDQIRALNENGIDEFLIWNAGNVYTPNVNYIP